MKVLVIASTLVLLISSLSITALADSQSQVQTCVALGFKADVCATCVIAGIRNDAKDYGPCFCKYDPAILARFPNMGACVSYFQQNPPM